MKDKISEILEELCLTPGLSGHEQPVSRLLKEKFESFGLEVTVDTFGNTYTLIKGHDHSKRVLLTGHMDQIGFLVKYIDEKGFIRLERVGGIPEKTLSALRVLVEAKDSRYVEGVIGVKSHHKTSPEEKCKVDRYQDLYVDIGCSGRKEVLDLGIKIGSAVIYKPMFVRLQKDRVSATTLDNRLACTCLVELAERLSCKRPSCDVILAGTVQEEFSIRGAIHVARATVPDAIICIDGGLASDTPDLYGTGEVELGNGPFISLYNFHGQGTLNGAIAHPSLVRLLEENAEKSGIHLQRGLGVGSLTELAYMQNEGMGIAGIDFDIPMRYAHSQIETADLNDIIKGIDLLECTIRSINSDTDFMSR
ncbi:MAG: hypothetical protein IKE38_01315 [Erysipelotrichaceae bacterium]|nr:hypothetical protein [Erysipelotrichaceae bacterium]